MAYDGSNFVSSEEPYACKVCSKTFSYKKTLARHVRNKHSIIGKPCTCQYCQSKFNDKWAMGKHIASTHLKKHHVVICPICHYKDSKIMIDIHFSRAHNIVLEEENYQFATIDEFESWKGKIEKTTVARFVVSQKFKKKNGAERIIYNCHRSGFFKPRGNNKRKIKTQGTNKIMGFCPARLEFEALGSDCILVQFVKTHVGHENDAEKVFSQYERRLLNNEPTAAGSSDKKASSDAKFLDLRTPIHLISSYCQIVDSTNLRPVLVGEFSFSDNVISFIRTQKDESDELELEEINSSLSPTLHNATVINVNTITAVDLSGDDVGLSGLDGDFRSIDYASPSADQLEAFHNLTLENASELESNGLLSTLDDTENSEKMREFDSLTKSPSPSSESAQLASEKQLLVVRFAQLIGSVDTCELLEEMKKICDPAMELMQRLTEQNLVDSTSPNTSEQGK